MIGFRHIRATLAALSVLAGLASASTAPLALDAGFTSSGVAALSTPTNYEAFVGATRGADGTVLAAGNFGTGLGSDLVLARFRGDGRLDAAFGLGGVVFHDAGARDDSLRAMTTLADGRIAAVGQSGGRALIAALRNDGALDSSFGVGGFFRNGIVGAARTGLSALIALPDGGLLACGSTLLADGEHALVYKLDANGALDRSFDLDGIRVLREVLGTDARCQRLDDGRIVVAARAPDALLLMRLTADGALDAGFGSGGIVIIARATPTPLVALLLAPAGYLVGERDGAHLTLVDAAGIVQMAQDLAPGAALTALAPSGDGRYALALATAAGASPELAVAQLLTQSASVSRPRSKSEIAAARKSCMRIAAKGARNACLAAASAPVVVPGHPITPTFAITAKSALPTARAEVLGLQPAAGGALLVTGFALDGGDTDFLLDLAHL